MPKISQAVQPTVQSQVVPGAKLSAIPSGGSPVANSLLKLADVGNQINNRVTTLKAEDALVNFERDKNDLFFNSQTGYFNTQGINAFDGAEGANKSLDDLVKSYGDNLDPITRQKFESVAKRQVNRSKSDVQRHATKGFQSWNLATIGSQVENTIENASLLYNQPFDLKVQQNLGEQAINELSDLTGDSAETRNEKLQTYRSSFAGATISAALAVSSDEAKVSMVDYGDLLEPPDKIKMNKAIDKKVIAEKDESDSTTAVLVARKAVSQFDDRGDIKDEIDRVIGTSDPVLNKKVSSEAMRQFSLKKQIESEANGDAYEDAENFIIDPANTVEQFISTNGEKWNLLSNVQKAKLKGDVGEVKTDWSTFSDLMVLDDKKLAKINPSDFFHKLAPTQRNRLITAVKSARGAGSKKDKTDHQIGRTRTKQTNSAVFQIFGSAKGRDNVRTDQFYALLDTEHDIQKDILGRELNSQEYTELLAGFTRKVVEEGTFFDSETSLDDIPVKDIRTLTGALRERNIPITTENLVRAWRDATR